MFKNRKSNYPLYNIRDLGSLRQLIDEGATLYGEKPAFRYRTGKSKYSNIHGDRNQKDK